jgi:CRISPR-associated endonuclease/helicase Cas3
VSAFCADDFPAFFRAVWEYDPFDWQTRLLARVRTDGWPSTLDLPTGSGKTATLDIALFALALDAFEAREHRRQPRRIVLVVDRRVVVDQAYERAVRLAETLKGAQDGILARVAGALRALQGDAEALPVLPAILRGGMPRESEWARTPHQPVLLLSTVDQVGSRLLFRGYGVSDRMKPVHAGLLGRDTLYLLDEVHLSRPFEETLEAAARYAGSERSTERLPRPLTFVRMSATVAERPRDVFTLTPADRTHPVLARRLGARKHALLQEVKTPKDPEHAREALAKACVREVERLGTGAARAIAVVVNRVDSARRVAALAGEKLSAAWDVKLMTGRMRPLDRNDLQADLLHRIRAGRRRTDDRVLLVSTQAVEAGADFDFDALVTECASLDALRQRFGRLDRFGDLGTTDAVVLAQSGDIDDEAPPDPVYGDALRLTWRWLLGQAEPRGDDGGPVVDFGIEALDARLTEAEHIRVMPLLAPRAVAPVLVPSHLDRWAQTSPRPSADPDVSPFLHGTECGAPDVQLVWRADIEAHMLADRKDEVVLDMLTAVPPSALEALPLPLWTVRRWLAAVAARSGDTASAAVPTVADVEGEAEPEEEGARKMAPVVVWRGDETEITSNPEALLPGDTVVVPSSYGGLAADLRCWDPSATEHVSDRGDQAQLLHRGRVVVRWNAAALGAWALPEALAGGPRLDPDDLEERGADAERDAFEAWRIAALGATTTPAWARFALGALGGHPRLLRLGDGVSAWRVTWRARRVPLGDLRRLSGIGIRSEGADASEAATEDDAGSFTGVGVALDRHLSGVRDFAQKFAQALALPPEVASDLALAGWLHDLGKADPRFQLMLHGGDPVVHALAPEPLAKSTVPAGDRAARERARQRARYPRGTRHELMSVELVQHSEALRARAHDWDLVLHLVASHHGYCRPFAPAVLDPHPVPVSAILDGIGLTASSDHRLVRIDSGVGERFWSLVRRYGWWGLAWLEAIVRLADHRESEQEVDHG